MRHVSEGSEQCLKGKFGAVFNQMQEKIKKKKPARQNKVGILTVTTELSELVNEHSLGRKLNVS